MQETTLVLGTDRRLRFIQKAVLEVWTHGACSACAALPALRTSTWARDPGTARPGSTRLRRAAPPA